MQRMRLALGVHRALRGGQRLAQHLPAEHEAGADIAALAAEQVVLQPLQLEQLDQFGDVVLRRDMGIPAAIRRQAPDYSGRGRVHAVARCCESARMRVSPMPSSTASHGNMRAGVELARHLQRRVVAGRHPSPCRGPRGRRSCAGSGTPAAAGPAVRAARRSGRRVGLGHVWWRESHQCGIAAQVDQLDADRVRVVAAHVVGDAGAGHVAADRAVAVDVVVAAVAGAAVVHAPSRRIRGPSPGPAVRCNGSPPGHRLGGALGQAVDVGQGLVVDGRVACAKVSHGDRYHGRACYHVACSPVEGASHAQPDHSLARFRLRPRRHQGQRACRAGRIAGLGNACARLPRDDARGHAGSVAPRLARLRATIEALERAAGAGRFQHGRLRFRAWPRWMCRWPACSCWPRPRAFPVMRVDFDVRRRCPPC